MPQANASPPPPINWTTRPQAYQQVTATLNGSQGPSSSAAAEAESATDDSGNRRQLKLLLRHLGRRIPVASGRNVGIQQDGTDFYGGESDGLDNPVIDNPVTTSPRFEQLDGLHSQNEQSEFVDLMAAFSRLSTSNNSGALVPRAAPGFPPYSSTSPLLPLHNAKYYVIIKGKCAGVYYGEWDDIRCLTEHVPGAVHKSFKTLEKATEFYLDAKRKNKVDYIRNPGDVARFGPDEDAIQ